MKAIAIDGPAGSGKSTVARRLATELHMAYLDTGAMYRAMTYYVLTHGIDPADEEAIRAALPNIRLRLRADGIWLNGEDVRVPIRSDEVTREVSVVCSYFDVRQKATQLQRELAAEEPSILDGRDIGTVVLPEACLKIFLTASPEARAWRRLHDEKHHSDMTYEQVFDSLRVRDYKDSHREIAPLRMAEDAILIDSSSMTIDEVVAEIRRLWEVCQ